MDPTLMAVQRIVEGPVFRFTFALLILGLLRGALLWCADAVGGYMVTPQPREFWRKARLRILWRVFPTAILPQIPGVAQRTPLAYSALIGFVSLIFRLGVVLVPTFMFAHVYLWERGLGVAWPGLPGPIADILSLVTIISGVALFFLQLYSPLLRSIEPVWAFFKPLFLLTPFLTGLISMHPTWSPVDYHVIRLIHVLSAGVVFALVPFARLLRQIHTPLTDLLPDVRWQTEGRNALLPNYPREKAVAQ